MARCTRRQFFEDSVLAAAVAAAFPAGSLLAADEATRTAEKESPATCCKWPSSAPATAAACISRPSSPIRTPRSPISSMPTRKSASGGPQQVGKQRGQAPKFVRDLRHVPGRQVGARRFDRHAQPLACPVPRSGPCRPARTSTWKSRSATTSAKAAASSRRPASYNRICQAGTQCRSMRGTIEAIDYVKAGKIGEVKLARGLCYKPPRLDRPQGPLRGARRRSITISGPARRGCCRSRGRSSTTTGTGSGNGATATWATRARTRWTSPAGAWASIALADRAIAYGGRLGYEDAGDVANTQVGIFEFGDKTLVFEVRGLETEPFRGARVGVIFYGSEGYVVLTSYTGGAACRPSIRGASWSRSSKGDGDHFGNFVDAVKARDPKLLARRDPGRPSLLCPQPPGQHLLLSRQAGLGGGDPQDAGRR